MGYVNNVLFNRSTFKAGFIPKLLFMISAIIPLSYTTVASKKNMFSIEGAIIVVIISAIVAGIAKLVLNISKKHNQKARDRFAGVVMERLNAGLDASQYSLYLRPFFTTNYFQITKETFSFPENKKPDTEMYGDIECLLAESVESIAPLIALGHPGEHIGAGRIKTSDDKWQQNIDALGNKATFLLVLPFGTEGTKWEIEWIKKNGCLNKSIFIMPPESITGKIDSREQWEIARSSYSKIGIHLPDYNSKGLLFLIDKDGTVFSSIEISSKIVPENLNMLINKLYSQLNGLNDQLVNKTVKSKTSKKEEEEKIINKRFICNAHIVNAGAGTFISILLFIVSIPLVVSGIVSIVDKVSISSIGMIIFGIILFIIAIFMLDSVIRLILTTEIILNESGVKQKFKSVYSEIDLNWKDISSIVYTTHGSQLMINRSLIITGNNSVISLDDKSFPEFPDFLVDVTRLFKKYTGRDIEEKFENIGNV